MRNATDASLAGDRLRRVFRTLVLHFVIPGTLIALALGYLSLVEFVERDPGFCAMCHETRSEYAMWSRSEHKGIVCQRCHHETQSEALRVLVKFSFSTGSGGGAPRPSPLHNPKVSIGACTGCHLSHDRQWPQIGGSVGHRVHVQQGKLSCLRCHGRSMHKFSEAAESCQECHQRQVKAVGMERLHCGACHNFLTQDETIKPSRGVCVECHRSRGLRDPEFPKNAPMVKLRCWTCHRPHQDTDTTTVPCESCHDKISRHGLHAAPEHRDCVDCHEAHSWATSEAACATCHVRSRSHAHFVKEPCASCHSFEADKRRRP